MAATGLIAERRTKLPAVEDGDAILMTRMVAGDGEAPVDAFDRVAGIGPARRITASAATAEDLALRRARAGVRAGATGHRSRRSTVARATNE